MTPAKPPGVYTDEQALDILDAQLDRIFVTARRASHTS